MREDDKTSQERSLDSFPFMSARVWADLHLQMRGAKVGVVVVVGTQKEIISNV